MSDEALNDIIKNKNDRIDDLEHKNNVLFKQLYEAKEELSELKSRIRDHFDDPSQILDEDISE